MEERQSVSREWGQGGSIVSLGKRLQKKKSSGKRNFLIELCNTYEVVCLATSNSLWTHTIHGIGSVSRHPIVRMRLLA